MSPGVKGRTSHHVVFWRSADDRRFGKLIRKPGYCHATFATKTEMAEWRRTDDTVEVLKILPITDPSLRDKFWFCQRETPRQIQQMILSTAEAAWMLGKGQDLGIITGPHDTRTAADDSADACWEAPGED